MKHAGWRRQEPAIYRERMYEIGLVWCAEIIWVITVDVCLKFGLANDLPGWPEPGMPFYRTSQPERQSSDSTRHMGIVVTVRQSEGYFETVEGNQGTSNRIGLYRYSKEDISRYSFEFICAGECAASQDTSNGKILAPTQECMGFVTG